MGLNFSPMKKKKIKLPIYGLPCGLTKATPFPSLSPSSPSAQARPSYYNSQPPLAHLRRGSSGTPTPHPLPSYSLSSPSSPYLFVTTPLSLSLWERSISLLNVTVALWPTTTVACWAIRISKGALGDVKDAGHGFPAA